MVQLSLYSADGKDLGQLAVPDEIFARPMNKTVVQATLTWFLAAQRSGTHSSKTRGEVRGGGIKPWKQKGTGRARAGSIRSPLWRKGGVIFGPKPRDYSYSLPKKIKKLALKIVLSDKANEQKMRVIEEFKVTESKTKVAAKLMSQLGIAGNSLLILEKANPAFVKAARNLPGVKLVLVKDLNIFDLLEATWIITEKKAVAQMEEVLA